MKQLSTFKRGHLQTKAIGIIAALGVGREHQAVAIIRGIKIS
jgi:hypothetical protein